MVCLQCSKRFDGQWDTMDVFQTCFAGLVSVRGESPRLTTFVVAFSCPALEVASDMSTTQGRVPIGRMLSSQEARRVRDIVGRRAGDREDPRRDWRTAPERSRPAGNAPNLISGMWIGTVG